MARTLPSINIPFTDRQGRMSPIWYEFLRSFVAASIDGTIATDDDNANISAGPGLTDTNSIFAVGAGPGIAVNDNDVSVDIVSQTSVQTSLEDEVMIADRSDNYTLRKTTVRSIAELAGATPGGLNSHVQYNANGIFSGHSGFTYDGAGGVYASASLTVGGTSITEGAVEIIRFDGQTSATAPRLQTDGGGGFILHSGIAGSDTGSVHFRSSGPPWISWTFNTGSISMANNEGVAFSGTLPLRRSLQTNITANTTQAQGDSALTRDYNNVTTVANVNDSVTLPAALTGRYCMVRNAGANTMKVWPASGDDLGAGVNTATTIIAGAHKVWVGITDALWHEIT